MKAAALALLVLAHAAAAAPDTPVVLELFTSEGCSSCPPAEELLDRLLAEPNPPVALEYHVDYWDNLGWKDPFGSPDWSRLQGRFAAAFESEEIFTPQAVFDGAHQGVASDEKLVRGALSDARAHPHPAKVKLQLSPVAAGKLPVAVEFEISRKSESHGVTLSVLLTEDALASNPTAGELSGQKLTHQRVVRLSVEPTVEVSGKVHRARAELALTPAWALPHLGVAALVRDARLRVLGAAFARP